MPEAPLCTMIRGTLAHLHKGRGVPDGKNFAGSIATTSRLVRTMVQCAGVELTAVVRMAALTPARMLGMDAEIGSIAVGKRADLLLLDSGLQVQGVIRDGKQVIDNRLN
ncbi:MAG: amidohydrolase family protein [Ruthenibacterium lactatiformans]